MEIESILNKTSELLNKHFTNIDKLCSSLKELCLTKIYAEKIKPFNIILAASDLYYLENFHSDILSYILNYKKDYFYYFIDYINTISENKIESKDYSNPIIKREEKHIDILIKDENSKHCFIIENKINNAVDTNRQLPKYYCDLKNNRYEVDGILYLSLDGSKRPDSSTWSPDDRVLDWDTIITYCTISNNANNDLVNGFLRKCIINADKIDEMAFFRQYTDLLLYLRRNQMDYQLMEKFYAHMTVAENYSTALSLRTMLDDLITFRRDKLRNRFINNCKPFDRVSDRSTWGLMFNGIFEITQENIKIEIVLHQEKTELQFWVQAPQISYDLVGIVLDTISLKNDFLKQEDNYYKKEFKFPEEEGELYTFVAALLSLMADKLGTIKEMINTKNGA
jgi:hypothetical protein